MYNFNIAYGDIFDYVGKADCICVTTNGTIKSNGELVMGAGVAKQFYDRYNTTHGIAKKLATLLFGRDANLKKLHVIRPEYNLCYRAIKAEDNFGTNVVSFPTKNHFQDKGDLELIKRSARRMVEFADVHDLKSIIIPSPGTGCGQLNEEDVYKELNKILDKRFTIIKFKKEDKHDKQVRGW